MAKVAKPTYSLDWYLPYMTRSRYDTKAKKYAPEVTKEYTRLRDIAQKRLKRLSQSEWSTSEVYRKYSGAFPKIADIKSPSTLAYKLSELARFVNSSQSTISGLEKRRKAAIAKLHEHELTFVNEGNLKQFGEFMEAWRADKQDELYDSGDAADAFYVIEKHGLDPVAIERDFDFWMDQQNLAIAKSLAPSKGKSKGSARRLRDRIQKKKKAKKTRGKTRQRKRR